MAYCIDPRSASGLPAEVHDTKQNDLGAIREFSDGTYVYLQGVANTVAGDWVVFDNGTFTTARATSSTQGSAAVATAAVVANKYGWYGYVGTFNANCLSATLSNGPIWATATAGSAEDVLVKNFSISNAVVRGAPVTTTGGGLQSVVINRPWIGNRSESA